MTPPGGIRRRIHYVPPPAPIATLVDAVIKRRIEAAALPVDKMIRILRRRLQTFNRRWAPVEIETTGEDNETITLTMSRGEHEEGIVILDSAEARDLVETLRVWLLSE